MWARHDVQQIDKIPAWVNSSARFSGIEEINMKPIVTIFSWLVVAGMAGLSFDSLQAAEKIEFVRDVQPILQSACVGCHKEGKAEGDLRIDTLEAALQGGESGPSIVPGEPEESPLYTLTILPADDLDIMPPEGAPLSKSQTEILRQWIEQGANWPEGVKLEQVRRIDFVTEIKPILEMNCVACHREGEEEGELRLDTRQYAMEGGESGPSIVPGRPEESPLYQLTTLSPDDLDIMPPKGEPLSEKETELLRLWILQGASWPEEENLIPRKKEEPKIAESKASQIVTAIHDKVLANLSATMEPYTATIPGTGLEFEMVPIPSGEFVMGSPESEPGHQPDESPQHVVKIAPFWMGKHEVTWDEYEMFMYPREEEKIRTLRGYNAELDQVADAVSRPTTPYVEMSFGMGKRGFPAISMTQHAANKYCQWLTAKTGQFYRLPTEAEWEYACRAGTTTAYSFGDDPALLDEYAWYAENSNYKYQKVGQKKPNPWGLHDMHGNVSEWVFDQYDPDFYQLFEGIVADNPVNPPVTLYPRVVRGGSWQDDPEMLRSAARRASEAAWKMQDPQLPKSKWYHTDAQFVGFRVVRPLIVPPAEELDMWWTRVAEGD